MVLSPKAKSAGWNGVHRPHTKLPEVLARHKGQADWAETIVDDESLFAQWISMSPGAKTPRRMNGDTREWWIVWSGTLRFTIEGREPIVASKGVMVQVPYRTLYQIENIGSEPALRFEVNVVRARKLYPMDEKPVPVAGFEYIPTRVTGGRGVLDPQNRQVVDFNKVVAGEERGGAFVTDDRSFANIIMGNYQRPQPGNKGHYHEEGGEFWLIMLGTIRYNIEGLQEFEAQEGDVVYVPRQTWHLASNGGKEGLRSCRLAMNGFPYQAHMFEQD
jgi:mannose-6-phosphate isomerase-like protein (cupin superfamily)